MKALVHQGEVKFLLHNAAEVEALPEGGIYIKTQPGIPDIRVGDIPLGEVEIVEGVDPLDLPEFEGGKYIYADGEFSPVPDLVTEE